MNDKVFLDTNVLIYAYSIDELKKQNDVAHILQKYEKIYLSTQVLNEFVHVMYKKKKLTISQIKDVLSEVQLNFTISIVSVPTINEAIDLAVKYRYSYFDSLMLASALENECSIIFSEDMHNSQTIEDSLKISNPFL